MTLSTRFKEAFKTALAMVLAYGIALSMDWEKPMWAAFAVAFITGILTLISLIPSFLAARLKPITAMSHFG